MDAGTLGAISTVLVTIAFFGVCYWAFSPKLKKRFEEDANLPFADELEENKHHQKPIDQKVDDQKADDQKADKL